MAIEFVVMLDIYCWAWGLVCIPSETLLEKSKFSFVASYQLEIASDLGMAVSVHFPSQSWGPGNF